MTFPRTTNVNPAPGRVFFALRDGVGAITEIIDPIAGIRSTADGITQVDTNETTNAYDAPFTPELAAGAGVRGIFVGANGRIVEGKIPLPDAASTLLRNGPQDINGNVVVSQWQLAAGLSAQGEQNAKYGWASTFQVPDENGRPRLDSTESVTRNAQGLADVYGLAASGDAPQLSPAETLTMAEALGIPHAVDFTRAAYGIDASVTPATKPVQQPKSPSPASEKQLLLPLSNGTKLAVPAAVYSAVEDLYYVSHSMLGKAVGGGVSKEDVEQYQEALKSAKEAVRASQDPAVANAPDVAVLPQRAGIRGTVTATEAAIFYHVGANHGLNPDRGQAWERARDAYASPEGQAAVPEYGVANGRTYMYDVNHPKSADGWVPLDGAAAYRDGNGALHQADQFGNWSQEAARPGAEYAVAFDNTGNTWQLSSDRKARATDLRVTVFDIQGQAIGKVATGRPPRINVVAPPPPPPQPGAWGSFNASQQGGWVPPDRSTGTVYGQSPSGAQGADPFAQAEQRPATEQRDK